MSAPATPLTERREKTRSITRITMLCLAAAIGLIALFAAWVWTQRYNMIERQIITYFDSINIEADLTLQSATLRQAEMRNIRLSYDGQPFLTVKSLQAAYQWRDLLSGIVDRVELSGMTASITVDETGKIIDGWRPPGAGGETSLPKDGISLRQASVTLRTPYGMIDVAGRADIQTADQFNVKAALLPLDLSYNEVQATLSGPFTLMRDQGPYRLSAPKTALSFDHRLGAIDDTVLNLDAQIEPTSWAVDGQAIFSGGTFSTQGDIFGQLDRVAIDGTVTEGRIEARLQTSIRSVSLDNKQRRIELSRTLSLANALSDVPAAKNFVPTLAEPLQSLLKDSDVDASVRLSMDAAGRELSLIAPMTVRSGETVATLKPYPEQPLYRYQNGSGFYDIAAHTQLSRPITLNLSPLQVRVRSEDGFRVLGVMAAEGQLKTEASWRARTNDGRHARLAPLDIAFDYNAPDNLPSKLTLQGQADYDGDIPGGYVDRLRAGGTLIASLGETGTRVNFRPQGLLRIARLETASDWIVQNVEGRIQPATPLFIRDADQTARIKTDLADMTFQTVRPASPDADAATLDMMINKATLSGRIGPDTQDWSGQFQALKLRSETFPLPETDLTLPEGTVDITLSPDTRTRFTLTTPSSVLLTPAYTVRGMALNLDGTVEDYVLAHQGGRVRLVPQDGVTVQVPTLPLTGTLRFADGQFTGDAETRLPRAPDNPVKVDYRLRDGNGDADVLIEALRFRPGGLQPQDLVPALRGKIAQVDGNIDAQLRVQFGTDTPLSGTGTVGINDVSLGTAPGPVTGLSGRVTLTSLFPVITAPNQRLTIETFNPGFPLRNGTLIYELIPEGVAIANAVFPLGAGQVSFDPFTWTYGAAENRVTLRVNDVEVGAFLEELADDQLSITGVLEGTIPVSVRGINVLVEKGRLDVRDGGVIRYQTQNIADAIPNEYAGKAMEALQNFKYESLFLELDGPLDGEVRLGLSFTGANPDVLYNAPFEFDVSVAGELFNIARSLNPSGFQDRILSAVANPKPDEPLSGP